MANLMESTSFLLLLLLPALLCEEPVDFSQHKLIKIQPKRAKHLSQLRKLSDEFEIDLWNEPMSDMRPVLTLIKPEESAQQFLQSLNRSGIYYEVAANNFQKVIDEEKEENDENRKRFRQSFDYENTFHRYEDINNELTRITRNNSKARFVNIGQTYEKRQIPAIIVTDPGVQSKQSVVLECGIHAREWLSTSTCLWIMNSLLTDQANDQLLKKFEFIIIPTMNPDGYVYTHTANRMWRKTRSPQAQGQMGADPNRNFDSAFGTVGMSKNPSSESYCGPRAFSEVETKALANFILSKKGNIAAYFAIHCFSQLWMYPYGYKTSPAPNYAQLEKLAARAVDAIKRTNGLVFAKGSIAKAIYMASGSSIDWAYDSAGIKVVYALELRDKGRYGFIMPPNQIKPAALETWNGLKAVLQEL